MTWSTHLMGGLSTLWLLQLLATATEPLHATQLYLAIGIPGSSLPLFPPPHDSLSWTPWSALPLTAGAAALGSLLPDLDAAHSNVKHLEILGIKPFYLPSEAIFHSFGHRTVLHSARGLIAVALLAALLSPLVGFQTGTALFLGYASHLMLDACNPSGIPLRYPDHRRYWLLPKRLRIVTGSPYEEIAFALLALLCLLYFFSALPFL